MLGYSSLLTYHKHGQRMLGHEFEQTLGDKWRTEEAGVLHPCDHRELDTI